MLLKPFTLAAASLAVATQAFLLPPEISQSDIDIVDFLPDVEALSVPQRIDLNVSCPGCVYYFTGKHREIKAQSDKPSHLELAFAIDHTSSGDRLLVNNFPLYPKANPFLYRLRSRVVPDGCFRSAIKEVKGHRVHSFPEQQLGYQLSVSQRAMSDKDGLALYELTLQIIEVGDVFVDGIPSVQVTLVKDIKSGALVIGGVTKSETEAVVPPMDEDKECTTFMCKWLAVMKDNMAKMKGKPCHGKMRGGAKGPRPHRGGHHHHKGRPNKMEGHPRHHSWGQLFKNVVQHIVLPIAVGIVAGVSVSLVGMMVGSLVVTVWRTFFRRPSHRRRSHSRTHSRSHRKAPKTEVAAAEVEEKSGLMEHQDPPPSYDEEALPTPPSYEEEVTPKTDV